MDADLGAGAGADRYLPKPLSPHRLVGELRDLIADRFPADRLPADNLAAHRLEVAPMTAPVFTEPDLHGDAFTRAMVSAPLPLAACPPS